MSLVRGGPAPCFLAKPVVDYILYGLERVKVCIEDVHDQVIKGKVQKVY